MWTLELRRSLPDQLSRVVHNIFLVHLRDPQSTRKAPSSPPAGSADVLHDGWRPSCDSLHSQVLPLAQNCWSQESGSVSVVFPFAPILSVFIDLARQSSSFLLHCWDKLRKVVLDCSSFQSCQGFNTTVHLFMTIWCWSHTKCTVL